MLATVKKWGNSNGIRLPKILLEDLNINENDEVELVKCDEGILVRKSKRKKEYKSLNELFKNSEGKYEYKELTKEEEAIIRKMKKERNLKALDELFKNFEGEYEYEEYDWGKPVGKEVWWNED